MTRSLRTASPEAAANEAIVIWQRLARKFVPLIGPSSVQLIVSRSIESCRPDFPWLQTLADPGLSMPPYDGLRDGLERAGKDAALAATTAMLTNYVTQLNTLIGGRLAEQFLRATFPAPADIEDTRSKSE